MAKAPQLTLHLTDNGVRFVVHNAGPGVLRLWDRSNSWGWTMLALELESTGQDRTSARLTPGPQRFTRNIPRFVEVAAGAEHTFNVPVTQQNWDGLPAALALLDRPLRVRGVLHIPPTPESHELDVYVGTMSSPWVDSTPPHIWIMHQKESPADQ
ncbi:MAG: hypothetical protein ACOZFS_04870 [Thermodesulfobacteriota bacterium]